MFPVPVPLIVEQRRTWISIFLPVKLECGSVSSCLLVFCIQLHKVTVLLPLSYLIMSPLELVCTVFVGFGVSFRAVTTLLAEFLLSAWNILVDKYDK